jgi:mono/diheme cytochrome c family protein
MRLTRIASILLLGTLPASAQTPAAQQYQSTVSPFLNRHCVMCHSTKAKAANLDLERFKDPAAALAERDVWEGVAKRVKSGQMPPPGVPKPSPESAQAVVSWAMSHVEAIDRTRKVEPGRVTARRLNRAEYNNTIRDLFAISFRPADDFPLDDSGHGFDNIGDVLSLSPVLLEKYMQAADKIVKAALVTGPPPKPVMEKFDADKVGEPKELPADPEGERLIRTHSLLVRYPFPRDGEYELRVFVRGRGATGSPPSPLALFVGGKLAEVIKVQSGQNTKRNFDVRIKATAGMASVGAAWVYPGPPYPGFAKDDNGVDYTMMVETIELRGPYIDAAAGLPESHRRVFICTEHDNACAQKILRNFASKAWRRPVTDAELARLMRFVELAAREGDTFENGIQLAVKAMLVSPQFLFRAEPEAGARALNGYELASRLSYFLWSTMPDDALFAAAADGSLTRPDVLAGQLRRMLADPKANALATNFAGQWLELRNLDSVSPDPERFPEWDADLREAMRRETLLFFSALLTEDRSILDLLDGKFSFLNERLARHYGIPDVTGRNFRRVELDGAQRSGVLTQASVLTVTSYPTRTSPVQRGLWVLENFLASPPPPPPADVPQLDEAKIGTEMTLRQQLERHRADPNCAVCHTKMDALGFGLENYNPVGAWRSNDGKFPIDSKGALPGGRSFTNSAELKTILRGDAEAFTECLTEKMLTYALGRGLEASDKPVVRVIAKRVAADQYKISTLIREIALSAPFRERSGERTQVVNWRQPHE